MAKIDLSFELLAYMLSLGAITAETGTDIYISIPPPNFLFKKHALFNLADGGASHPYTDTETGLFNVRSFGSTQVEAMAVANAIEGALHKTEDAVTVNNARIRAITQRTGGQLLPDPVKPNQWFALSSFEVIAERNSRA